MQKLVLKLLLVITIITFTCSQTLYTLSNHQNATSKNKKDSEQTSMTTESPMLSRDSLSQLKAILIVAPHGRELTKEAIKDMKETSNYLRSVGVNVFEFYDKEAKWDTITKASNGAHIFVYCGHGSTLGLKGIAGGLYLANKSFISARDILKELKLNKNALVIMNNVCRSAGSSADDTSDIGIKKATDRVSDYAMPFIMNGAAGYYATNNIGPVAPILKRFFKKQSIKQIFIHAASGWDKIETSQKFGNFAKYEISITSSAHQDSLSRIVILHGKQILKKFAPYNSYDLAYVGIPTFNVLDFFK